MNDHQVSQLVATLEGAYPQSKISPSKVQATWQASKRLQAFNNAHRADLINYVLKAHRFFPSLPEIMDACDAVEPREREGDCLACNGRSHIDHLLDAGSKGIRRAKVSGGDGLHDRVWFAVRGSNQPDHQQNGRTPVVARPVGFHNASLRTTSGRGGIETSVAHESENGVFVASVHTLILKNFGCADTVGVAGSCLCGFHYLKRAIIARRSPRFPMGTPGRFKPRQNAGDPTHGQG